MKNDKIKELKDKDLSNVTGGTFTPDSNGIEYDGTTKQVPTVPHRDISPKRDVTFAPTQKWEMGIEAAEKNKEAAQLEAFGNIEQSYLKIL